MTHSSTLKALLFATTIVGMAVAGEPQTNAFNAEGDAGKLSIKGDAAFDKGKTHAGNGGSLRVGPGAVVTWPLRDSDGAGRVSFRIYEDMTTAAEPKKRRAGPQWGVMTKGGRRLMVGNIYAPYLNGAKTHAVSDYKPPNASCFSGVQYLGTQRKKGWTEWTFLFDAEKGCSIHCNGKKATRFNWDKTQVGGFAGIVFVGDQKSDKSQTIWIDDISAKLNGAMKAKPAPPPPPAPVTPAKDPEPKTKIELLSAVKGKHPRLLFTAEDIERIKGNAKGGSNWFFKRVENYLKSCKAPNPPKFLHDATDAQRHGFWRSPTAAIHYAITGSKDSYNRALGYMKLFLKLDHWEAGREQDSGMGAANIAVGAALCYDLLYNDLGPEFRESYRKKLLLQARRQYHRGHLCKAKGVHYWQNDPQNNHRWHRNAGLALMVLGIAGDGPGDGWILEQLVKELDFIHEWLPEDGTSHESPSYMIFGLSHLALAFDAAQRCLGKPYLKHPFFRNVSLFRIHTSAPGFTRSFGYGDSSEGAFGAYGTALYLGTSVNKQKDEQAGLDAMRKVRPNMFDFGWFGCVWHDPNIKGGSLENLPKNIFFPDMGLGILRDGWKEENVGFMLKCAPYGGLKLNEYRNSKNGHYINVAHDDPDANSFMIYANKRMLAKSDAYSMKKTTDSHNTILVNGKGQKGEGGGWTQPLRNKADMLKLAWVTAWKKTKDGIAVVEGEAGGSYPDLDRYRRAAVWVPGKYILLFDDIRAQKDAELTWLVQGREVSIQDQAKARFMLKEADAKMDFQVTANVAPEASVVDSPARSKKKPLGYKQLRLKAKTKIWKVATVFNAWDQDGLSVQLKQDGDVVTVKVSGPGIADSWTLKPAGDVKSPSEITGTREGKILIKVGAEDMAPQHGEPVQ